MSKFASFVRSRNTAPTAAEIAKAEIVTDVNVLLSLTTLQEKYQFSDDAELTKFLAGQKQAEILVKEYNNGEPYNVVISSDAEGNNRQQWIVFGNKGSISAARKLTAAEIKKLTAGTCTQSGEIITDTMEQAGKLYRVPRKYCKLS